MKSLPILLTALLGGQLALALTFAVNRSDHAAFEAKEPLVSFVPSKVDQIAIDDDAGHNVTLQRKDGKWVIPASADFPADTTKINGLLDRIAGLKKGWPVAKTDAAAERFKVTEKVHERRVVLTSGGSRAGELLVGTSPAYRQVHVRAGDASPVFAVELATYDIAAEPSAWMQQDMLDTPRDKIASVNVGDVTIEGKDGKFTLAGLGQDEKPRPDKIDALVSAMAHPPFDGVRGKGKAALSETDAPDVTVTLKRTDGSQLTYRYKKDAAGGGYLFTRSAEDYLFHASADAAAPIVQATRATLTEPSKPDKAPDTGGASNKSADDHAATAETAGAKPDQTPAAAETVPASSHGADQASHGGAEPAKSPGG
ncbi:DUF4340 domain-containing protein [Bradyrhizobium sp. STM 3809]|uniref:DUF4340 domain-containing protein n=1 Tax=Bradyrhizobium sp. STM 3809 TaxID=551936 RepID=UPI0002409E28|nr:DUF4340 domain-containing protein [Bradyrhizobium sp. STM 3809]CCE02958.1 conserved exported hypothetical protein [Bradyrhizobium sp. STM 3809]